MTTAAQMIRAATQSNRKASALERIQPAAMVPDRPAIQAARMVSVGDRREGMEDILKS